MENLVLVPLLVDNQSNSRLPDPKMNSSLFTQTIILEDLEYSHMDQFYGTFLTFCGAFSVHTELNYNFLVNLNQYATSSHHYISKIHPNSSLHLIRSSYGITTMSLRRSSSSTTNIQSWNWLKERLKMTNNRQCFCGHFLIYFSIIHTSRNQTERKITKEKKTRNNSTFHAVERWLQQSHKQEKLIKSSVTRGKRHSRALLFPLVT